MNEKEIEKKKIGSRIRAIRNELGLTMKEFGKKFDPPASDSIVSRWERGISIPNNERLERISELGNVSMLYLTTGNKAFSDLTEDEVKDSAETLAKTFEEYVNEQKDYYEEEFERILNSNLGAIEVTYLTSVLNFLKFEDAENVKNLAVIIHSLNQARNLKAGNLKDHDMVTKEELNSFFEDELREVEKTLRSIYFDENKEGD